MKNTRAFICIILVAALLSGLSVCMASNGKDYSGYEKYVSLGDSIANGIGENNVENKYMNRTPGAYPDRIANEIGADLTQLACGGMRTVELRACLEDNYYMPDEFANNFSRAKVAEIKHLYAPAIKEADFITLNIGSNDILTYAMLRAKAAGAELGIIIDKSVTALEANGNYFAALVKLLETAKTVNKYASIVPEVIDGLYDGYTHFCENWDAIIGDIYTLNPNATLMVAGFYNPFPELKISDDSTLELGKAADGIMQALNVKIKTGSPYSDRYIYVDIMGVQSMATKFGDSLTDEGFFQSLELDVHPSNEGQAEIARRFIELIPECTGLPFTDIANKPHEFKDAIKWAYENGITEGKTANSFCPDEHCTRAQIVTMLWRSAGCPTVNTKCAFTDVSADSYYCNAVNWAVSKGIVKGYTDSIFAPDELCTRAQIVSFLYRFEGSPKLSGGAAFSDVSADSYYANAVAWAVKNGITKGFEDGTFQPETYCTRAQAVAFIFRDIAK